MTAARFGGVKFVGLFQAEGVNFVRAVLGYERGLWVSLFCFLLLSILRDSSGRAFVVERDAA